MHYLLVLFFTLLLFNSIFHHLNVMPDFVLFSLHSFWELSKKNPSLFNRFWSLLSIPFNSHQYFSTWSFELNHRFVSRRINGCVFKYHMPHHFLCKRCPKSHERVSNFLNVFIKNNTFFSCQFLLRFGNLHLNKISAHAYTHTHKKKWNFLLNSKWTITLICRADHCVHVCMYVNINQRKIAD